MFSTTSLSSLNNRILPQNMTGVRGSCGVGRVLALSLDPLVDKKGAFAHVTPTALALTGAKSLVLTGITATNVALFKALVDLQKPYDPGFELLAGMKVATPSGSTGKIVERSSHRGIMVCVVEMDNGAPQETYSEQDLCWNPPDLMDVIEETNWSGFPQKVVVSFTRNVTTTSTCRYIEFLMLSAYTKETVGKFMKDAPKEAVRHMEASGSRIAAGGMMLESGFYGCVVGHTSVFITQQIFDTIRFLNHKRLAIRHGKSKPHWSFSQYTSDAAMSLLKSSGSIITSSICAAVGTCIFPGTGTGIGLLVGDTVCYLL